MPTPRDNDDALTPDERLRLQNELLRAELESDHGAVFGDDLGADPRGLTPDMERAFLERIRALEAGGDTSHYVAIRTLVPRRALKQASAKTKGGDFAGAIALLEGALANAGVMTQQPEWLAPRGYYHYLVEDLLAHTIPPPPPPTPGSDQRHMIGVMYEQVRQDSPQHLFDITLDFVGRVLNLARPFDGEDLFGEEVRRGAGVQTRAEAIASVHAWRARFSDIEPGDFVPRGHFRGPDGAIYFGFDFAYKATEPPGKVHLYEGDGAVQVDVVDKRFVVIGCSMPGFEL